MTAPAPEQIEQQQLADPPRWKLSSRIAFRLSFIYFLLYCLSNQILGGLFPIPKVNIPELDTLVPLRPMVFWSASHIFHVSHPLVFTGSGSGDKTFDWVLSFCLLVIGVAGTTIWSILDRGRTNYITMYKWFRLFLRFALASEMLIYGLAKAVPLQMPFPYLTRLLEPYGNFSPMGVLWASIGASPGYEIFAGCAETLGGILLIVPRLTMFGALICLIDMVQVFMLNMTYDVPVKQLSFHLILISMFLLAPEATRLVNFLVLNRTAQPSTEAPLFSSRRRNRMAIALQIIFGLAILGLNIYSSAIGWRSFGAGRTKSPLYGIWNVSEMSVNGTVRPPLATDNERWRRVVFDFPNQMTFERFDDSLVYFNAAIDEKARTIALSTGANKGFKANLAYSRSGANELALDGDFDGHNIHMRLQVVDRSKFLLVNRGFHWIQEYPFNR